MSEISDGRKEIIRLLEMNALRGAIDELVRLSQNHETDLVSGVLENVVTRNGKVHRDLQTGKNQFPSYFLRIGTPDDQIVCTYVPAGAHKSAASCFLRKRPDQHSDVEVVMGMANALRGATDHFGDEQNNLLRHTLLSALYFDIFPLAGIWGPSTSAHRGRTDIRRKVFNKIIDVLIWCGMSMPQIREHFLSCLRFNHDKRPIDYVLKMASAKCFPNDQIHDELSDVLRQHYFERFWRGIVEEPHKHSGDLLPFGYLARAGMVGAIERTEIEASLTELLATGMFRQALEIVTHIGEQLGLYHTQSHPGFCVTKGPVECHRECVISVMQNLSYKAFHIASGESQWGRAASLVLNFGCDHLNLDTDGGNEVVRRALEHNQPIPVHLFDFYST